MISNIIRCIKQTERDIYEKRKGLVVYDVQYLVTDPETGKRVKKHRRGFVTKQLAESFILEINRKDAQGICNKRPI